MKIVTANELKALRKSLGLSMADAARQVEVNPRTWAKWESTHTIPRGALRLFKLMNKIVDE